MKRVRELLLKWFPWLASKQENPQEISWMNPMDDLPTPFDKRPSIPDLISGSMLKTLWDQAERFWNLGVADGKLFKYGSSENVNTLASSEANIIKEMALESLEGNKASYDKERLDLMDQLETETRPETLDKRNYLQSLSTNSRYTNGFAWGMGLIYLACGLLLLFSDVVLALQLMSVGFDEFVNRAFPIANLFYDPIGVFFANWQVILTSLGIATITVYIKVFYDEYLALSDGSAWLRLQKLKQQGVKNWALIIELGIKLAVKVTILCSVIYLLIVLAEFRFQSLQLLSGSSGDLLEPSSIQSIGKDLFLWMTVVFPVVAGVLFSLSLKIFLNVMRLTRAKKELRQSEAREQELLKSVRRVKEKVSEVQTALDSWNAEGIHEQVVSYLMAYYMMGFHRGDSHYDPLREDGNDLVDRVRIYRSRAIAKQQAIAYGEVK